MALLASLARGGGLARKWFRDSPLPAALQHRAVPFPMQCRPEQRTPLLGSDTCQRLIGARASAPRTPAKSRGHGLSLPGPSGRSSVKCHVSTEKEAAGPTADDKPAEVAPEAKTAETTLEEKLASFGIFAFWGAWFAYAFLAAPNQTRYIDQYYLEKLVGLHGDDGFILNQVVTSLWNIMGVWPLVYIMLLIPAARTDRTKLPVWPFALVSVGLGAFALLPYFALWTSGTPSIPSEEERKSWGLRIWESKITAGAALLLASGLLLSAATAPSGDWIEFNQIVQQSRLFHVTTSDFFVLTLSAPFWVYNDMAYRNWEPRSSWGLALLALPVLGPCIYLVLRPGLPDPPKAS